MSISHSTGFLVNNSFNIYYVHLYVHVCTRFQKSIRNVPICFNNCIKFQMVHPQFKYIYGNVVISSSIGALYSSPSTSKLTQMQRSAFYLYPFTILLNHVRVFKMLETIYYTHGITYNGKDLVSGIYTPFQ